MTTSNNGSYCGSNGNSTGNGNTGHDSHGTTNWRSTGNATSGATATCNEPTCGSTFGVNEIPTAGCYVCHWNGSLLRVSDAAFTTGGFTSFNFTSSDPLTVTFLTADPAATIQECRTYAESTNVYCGF